MFGKLSAFWNLLKVGQEVSNVEFWKKAQSIGQPTIAALLMAIVALTKGTKYEIPLDNETALLIGGSIFAIVNWILTLVTSKRVGLPSTSASSAVQSEQLQSSVQESKQVEQSASNMQIKDSDNIISTISEADIAKARAFVAGKLGNK